MNQEDSSSKQPQISILWEGRTEEGHYKKIFQVGEDPSNLLEAVRLDAGTNCKPLILDLGYETPFTLKTTEVYYGKNPLSLDEGVLKSSYFEIVPQAGQAIQVSCKTEERQDRRGEILQVKETCFRESVEDWKTWRIEERSAGKEVLPLDLSMADQVGCRSLVEENIVMDVQQSRHAKTFLFKTKYPALFNENPMHPENDNPSPTPEPSSLKGHENNLEEGNSLLVLAHDGKETR